MKCVSNDPEGERPTPVSYRQDIIMNDVEGTAGAERTKNNIFQRIQEITGYYKQIAWFIRRLRQYYERRVNN